MPSLYSLNSQSHPFWDFVASLDEGASGSQPSRNQQTTARSAESSAKEETSAKQPTVEDEVAAEPSQEKKGKAPEAAGLAPGDHQQMPIRGRGPCGGEDFARRAHTLGRSGPCHGRRGGRGGFGEPHHRHPPGDGFDGFGDFDPSGVRGPLLGGLGWFDPVHRGSPSPVGPPAAQHSAHPHHDRPQPAHRPHHHHNRWRGPRGGPTNFNLGEFLSNLGSRLGLDLSGALEGLNLDRFSGGTSTQAEVDFEPRADIFDTPSNYLVHLSLPGAKKEDLGVDWDGENSVLRVGGVVHRPGVDEETLKLLAVDGRKTEVGVFEKKVILGTKRDPAKVDIAGITAKMTDGVLVVNVPKLEVEHKKREVPISGSASPSPVREEKQGQEHSPATQHTNLDVPAPHPVAEKGKEETVATEMEVDDAQSETEKRDEMEHEDPPEQLPEYHHLGQHDAAGSEDDEGEYVKIDVQ